MGTAALGQCFGTVSEAALAVCAGAYPLADAGGLTQCTAATAAVLSLDRSGPAPLTYTVTVTGPACDVATFAAAPLYVSPADAALIGLAVAAVFGAAFGWRAMVKALD